MAVEALSAADCTLLKAEVARMFMLDEISAQNNTLTKELRDELISRIQERRTIYSDTMQFLHNPLEFRNIHFEDNYDLFQLYKPSLTKIIVSLIERLNMTNEGELTIDSNYSSDDVDELVDAIALTMKDRLQLAIKNQSKIKINKNAKTAITTNTRTLTKLIKQEIAELEEEQSRGKYLTMAFNYLLTIKPTSVESERAFSAAGLICTKIKTSLSDKKIDAICLLRAYFNTQDFNN